MFRLYANKNKLEVREKEPITSGSVNVYTCRFEFSPDWKGLTRKAVFIGSGSTIQVLLDESGECFIPWEVLTTPGWTLYAGVYGSALEAALPTIKANLGQILEGVKGGDDAQPPTHDLWEQELAKKGDALAYDGSKLSLMSGENELSSVEIPGGGGESVVYKFGHGLKQDGVNVSVDMSSRDNPDRTLPVSAATMDCVVGNIEILLKTI